MKQQPRKLQSQSSLRVRPTTEEFGSGPQLPSTPRDASRFLSKYGGKRGTGRKEAFLRAVLPKAGKANYMSRLAARSCACALIPVAILPLLRHRKQTQFLVSPSLGGGAF